MEALILCLLRVLWPPHSVDNLPTLAWPETQPAPPQLSLQCCMSETSSGSPLPWHLLVLAQRQHPREPFIHILPGSCRRGTVASALPRGLAVPGPWPNLDLLQRMQMIPRARLRGGFWRAPQRMMLPHRWDQNQLDPLRRSQCTILPFHMFDPQEVVWEEAAQRRRVECIQREDPLDRRGHRHPRQLRQQTTQLVRALLWLDP